MQTKLINAKSNRTTIGLRDRLFEAIDALRDGDILAEDAKAISLLAKEISNSQRMEIEMEKWRIESAKIINQKPDETNDKQ